MFVFKCAKFEMRWWHELAGMYVPWLGLAEYGLAVGTYRSYFVFNKLLIINLNLKHSQCLLASILIVCRDDGVVFIFVVALGCYLYALISI